MFYTAYHALTLAAAALMLEHYANDYIGTKSGFLVKYSTTHSHHKHTSKRHSLKLADVDHSKLHTIRKDITVHGRAGCFLNT